MPTQADQMLIDLFEVVYLSRHIESYPRYVRRKGSGVVVKHSFATQSDAEHALKIYVRTRITQLQHDKHSSSDEDHISVRQIYINHK